MRPFSQALLACALSLASTASSAPVAGVPNALDVGPHQVLIENDLAAGAQAQGAVALLSQLSQAEAAMRCALLSEKLLSFPTTANNREALDSQLSYLSFSKALGTPRLWIASIASAEVCQAYDSSAREVVSVDCGASLNALCSSSGILSKDTSPLPDAKVQITVQAKDVTVTGYRDARSYRFLGIPYADPPTGQRRFANPAPYSGPKQVSALKYGASCPQPRSGAGSLDGSNLSEDCLFVSVITPYLPAADTGRARPVAVWIHGGDYFYGSSALGQYDLTNFASRNDAVMVSIQYRLGAAGFLSSKTLLDGNYAIKDQIAALQWVQRNIASFGGDPSRVTVFGESAGGQSVVALLSSTAAKGLFSAAIVQSNPIDLPWFTRELYTNTITPNVAFAAGCARLSEAEMVDCLRKVPIAKLLTDAPAQVAAGVLNAAVVGPKYLKSSPVLATIEPFLPIVGGSSGVIDDQFVKLLASGKLPVKVPTLFTTVKDEASLFVGGVVPVNLGKTQLLTDAGAFIAYSPTQAAAMVSSGQFKVNSSDPDGTRSSIARSFTQTEWLCSQEYLLDRYHAQFPSLWAGLIVKGHNIAIENTPGSPVPVVCNQLDTVCHVGEVLPAFGTLNYATKNVLPYRGETEVLYSQILNDIWSAFFRTQNPTPAADYLLARGRKYTHTYDVFYRQKFAIKQYASRQDTAILGYPEDLGTGTGPLEAQCSFFESKAPGGFGGFTFDRV